MYKDRGIIKWAPFDALVGFQNKIDEMLYERGKKEKPILCEDKLIEMDRVIMEALNEKKEVLVSYYEDGYIKNTYGFVEEVDKHKKTIEILKLVIPFKNILDLEIF